MIVILLLNMLLASAFTFGKAALAYSKPFFLIGVRMLLGGVLLTSFLYARKIGSLRVAREHYWLFAQIIFFHIYIAYIAEFWALQYVSSAKACLLFNLSPFITAIFAYLFLHERMTRKKWYGLLVGVIGFLPIMLTSPATEATAGSFVFISLPEIALLVSVAASAQGWIVMKQLINVGYSPLVVNSLGMLVGGGAALITSLLCETSPLMVASSAEFMTWGLYTLALVIIGNIVCYNLYGYLLHRYSATFLSFAGFTAPLFAALYGRIFLHEAISIWFFVTMLIVSFGLYLFYQEELVSNH